VTNRYSPAARAIRTSVQKMQLLVVTVEASVVDPNSADAAAAASADTLIIDRSTTFWHPSRSGHASICSIRHPASPCHRQQQICVTPRSLCTDIDAEEGDVDGGGTGIGPRALRVVRLITRRRPTNLINNIPRNLVERGPSVRRRYT